MPSTLTLLPRPRSIQITGNPIGPLSRLRFSEAIESASVTHAEGYRLTITPDAIALVAHDAPGLFYGKQTLVQLQREPVVPACVIEDWPDFPHRGVMLDISRDKVPTLATLYRLVDLLASLKINQLQLYTEHTFAYRDHRVVWEHASPITAEEVRQLDAYCRERFIELVPNQNSFGHMERWFKHEAYRDLAECPDGAFYWNEQRPPATLNPLDPRSIELVRQLHAELLANFTSRQFNVGCDETVELGMGRSKAEAEKLPGGVGRVYLDFLAKIYDSVRSQGRTMQFWADIILKHPELVPELPGADDVVALIWGYEANHPFEQECRKVAEAGRAMYVCPGTSTWNAISGRTDNALVNIRRAAEAGLKHGAIGLLNTDWGDHGHMQPLSASFPTYAYGAAMSWCVQSNRWIDLAAAVNRHVVMDMSNTLTQAMLDLGNAYAQIGDEKPNRNVLFTLLLSANGVDPATLDLRHAKAWIADARARIVASSPTCVDGQLIKDEMAYAADLLTLACDLGLGEAGAADIDAALAAHQRIWLARNRPGGMADSAARLAKRKSSVS